VKHVSSSSHYVTHVSRSRYIGRSRVWVHALVPSLSVALSLELATGWPIAAKKSFLDDTRPQIDEDGQSDFGLRGG